MSIITKESNPELYNSLFEDSTIEDAKKVMQNMFNDITPEQFEEYKKELTNNTYCVICKKEINGDSQFVKGKWYHNDCIEELQEKIDNAKHFIYGKFDGLSWDNLKILLKILGENKGE